MTKVNDPAHSHSRTLRSGTRIPAIGFGTFGSDHIGHDDMAAAVATAIRAGYRLIDCAAVYGNEREIGAAIARTLPELGLARGELYLMSKVWNDAHAPAAVQRSVRQSITDLGCKYLDACFIHWPFRNYHAPFARPDDRNPDSHPFILEEFLETWAALETMHDAGLVRQLGMSNMTVAKLERILPRIRIRPELIEMELHPAFQQPGLFEYARERGIQPVGYAPLGSPSRPERDTTPEDVNVLEMPVIRAIAAERGVHPATVALLWAITRGQIPIPLSTNPAHIQANLAVLDMEPLSAAEMHRIAAADANCRLIKGQVFLWPGASDWRVLWDQTDS
ncbi:MAG: aldo/keto reductase [Bacillota bacterium]|nr:aldo/keto reductase [Bacillota bacterium]